jgi:hypothetical protein
MLADFDNLIPLNTFFVWEGELDLDWFSILLISLIAHFAYVFGTSL